MDVKHFVNIVIKNLKKDTDFYFNKLSKRFFFQEN